MFGYLSSPIPADFRQEKKLEGYLDPPPPNQFPMMPMMSWPGGYGVYEAWALHLLADLTPAETERMREIASSNPFGFPELHQTFSGGFPQQHYFSSNDLLDIAQRQRGVDLAVQQHAP